VVLIHRVPSVALGPRMAKLRYYVMANSGLVILIILISESGGGVALPVGGTWLLIGVAITVCGAAAQRRG
jgi:hypothetical protein